MPIPGASKYERIPTRQRIQLVWIGLLCAGAAWELNKFTLGRVVPRREEHVYEVIKDKYGEDLPPKMIESIVATKEAREALSLQRMLETPTPGELSGALQHELDPRRIKELRRNGN